MGFFQSCKSFFLSMSDSEPFWVPFVIPFEIKILFHIHLHTHTYTDDMYDISMSFLVPKEGINRNLCTVPYISLIVLYNLLYVH